MKRPSLRDVSHHYLDIFDWIRSYIDSDDDVQGLTNQLYHLSNVRAKNSFVAGLVVGVFVVLILLSWLR